MTGPVNLLSLPIEILLDIHLLSASADFPLICKRTWTLFSDSNTTTARYRAIYLWRKYVLTESLIDPNWRFRRTHRWDAIVTNGCCTLEVLMILRSFHQSEFPPHLKPSSSLNKSDQIPPSPVITIEQIPTRLFKPMTSKNSASDQSGTNDQLNQSYQYISALLKDFGTSPDKTGGYPLARSVLSASLEFIRLLLDFGARPRLKDNLVIMLAIGMGDLCLLRMLVEQSYVHPNEVLGARPRKKAKMRDRVKIDDRMLEKAMRRKDYRIADYLMGKGARPTLKTIRFLESSK